MNKDEAKELTNKIEIGMKLAVRRLYERGAERNEMFVISENNVIKHLSGKELLARLDADDYGFDCFDPII